MSFCSLDGGCRGYMADDSAINLFCDDADMSDRIECLAILGDWPLYQQSRWILEVIAKRDRKSVV